MAPNIATNTGVTLDELLDFVRPRHRAILLTRRADGSPQGSPLTCGVDDSGRIVVSTYPERAKTRNAKRDERVSLIVLSDDWNGPWVQIDGTAEVIDTPDSVEPLVEYYRNIAASTRTGTSTARPWSSKASRSSGSPRCAGVRWRRAASRRAWCRRRTDRSRAPGGAQPRTIIASIPAISVSSANVKSRSRISSTVSPPRASMRSAAWCTTSVRSGLCVTALMAWWK